MKLNEQQPDNDQMPEYQIFPRGSLLIMFAGILMVMALIFVVVLLSYALSFALQKNTVTVIIVGLIPFLAIAVVTPGFMITRGKSHWQRAVEVLNGSLMAVLLIGVVAPLWLGDMGMSGASLTGLAVTMIARARYRSGRYRDGVEYYRRVWAIYRKNH